MLGTPQAMDPCHKVRGLREHADITLLIIPVLQVNISEKQYEKELNSTIIQTPQSCSGAL